MWTYNTIIVLLGASLLGVMCGVVGSFAVLKKRALVGDVLGHAALPGIALAFWITHSKSLPILLLGALATGLLGIWSLGWLRKHTRTKEDAAMGLILSVFFGAGIALTRHIQNVVPDASKAGLDNYIFGKTAGILAADVVNISVISAAALLVVIVLFKEIRTVVFDPHYSHSIGLKTFWIEFLVMALLTLIVVIGLPMVGIIMIAALTLLPPITARLWTHQLPKMLVLAGVIGMLSTSVGVLLSSTLTQMPTGPLIILSAGGLFLFSILFAPEQGVLSQGFKRVRFRLDWGVRTLLFHLQKQPSLTLSETLLALDDLGISYPRWTLKWAVYTKRIESSSGTIKVTAIGDSWLKSLMPQEEEKNKP